jgi:small-conductance mechanosensitive channel
MVLVPSLPTFEIGDAQWMNEVGWPILALVGVLTVSLYVWSYLSKNYENWKAHEGRYFDSDVLDASRRTAFIFIVSLFLLCTYIVISIILNLTSDPSWGGVTNPLFKLFTIIIIILASRLAVMVLNRMVRKHRADRMGGNAMPAALEFSTLLLSYAIYIISAILVLLMAFSIFMNLNTLFGDITDFLSSKEPDILATLAIVIGIYLAIKMEETILEDIKFRSRKFNPQVIDLIQVGIRYILKIIGVLIVIFNLFSIIGMGDVGILLVLVTLIFICLAIVMAHSTIQNIISGLVLMDTSPFEVGDRIRIMNGMLGDVFEKGLVFTKVKTLNGEIVDVPNSKIMREEITNFARLSVHRICLDLEVSFDIPHEKVESNIREALEGIDGILDDPKPTLLATDICGDLVRYEITFFIKDLTKEATIRSSVIQRIQDIFHAEDHLTLVGRHQGDSAGERGTDI